MSKQCKGVNESEAKTKDQTKHARTDAKMSNTTAIIITVVIPLMLSGFLNFHANKPWILYFPLLGILVGLGYAGHLWIQSYYKHPVDASPRTAEVVQEAEAAKKQEPLIAPKSIDVTDAPSKLYDEISAAKPLQQDALRESLMGAKVRWLLKLSTVNSISSEKTLVMFDDGRGLAGATVAIEISNADKDILRLSEKGALYYVSGCISKLSLRTVWLDQGALEPYKP